MGRFAPSSLYFTCNQSDTTNVSANAFLVKNLTDTFLVSYNISCNFLKTGISNVMYVKNDSVQKVLGGKLLNKVGNTSYCVYEIEKNISQNNILEIRNTPIKMAEPLYVLGWTNMDEGSQRTYIYTYLGTDDNFIKLRRINAPEEIPGLKGAPVVDNSGKLVGMVSSLIKTNDTGELILQAISSGELKSVLKGL